MLFNGGLVPTYMMYTGVFHIKNTIWALLIPNLLVRAYYVMLMRSYFQTSIPEEILEAASIDGASEFQTFYKVSIPMAKPIIATVALFSMILYWNDWQNALLYITSDRKKPLQLLLINIQKSIEFLLNNSNVPASVKAAMGGTIPQYSATMATVIVVIGPIMVIYPFFQKYFVKGLTVGSVKG